VGLLEPATITTRMAATWGLALFNTAQHFFTVQLGQVQVEEDDSR
jgi:hypothetical protein